MFGNYSNVPQLGKRNVKTIVQLIHGQIFSNKRNKLLHISNMCMNFKHIMLIKRSHAEEVTRFYLYSILKKAKLEENTN